MFEDYVLLFSFYSVGTLIGIIISKFQYTGRDNEVIEWLIDNGFLRTKEDEDGNVVIKKWHDNR